MSDPLKSSRLKNMCSIVVSLKWTFSVLKIPHVRTGGIAGGREVRERGMPEERGWAIRRDDRERTR